MATAPATGYGKLVAVMRRMESAHAAIRDGIATHAQKHEAAMLARRKSMEVDHAIQSGIARGNS